MVVDGSMAYMRDFVLLATSMTFSGSVVFGAVYGLDAVLKRLTAGFEPPQKKSPAGYGDRRGV
jgi:hypothetical protein